MVNHAFLFDDPILINQHGVFSHIHTSDSFDAIVPLLRSFWRQRGVIVSSIPYSVLTGRLASKGVRTDRLSFVDLVSKSSNKQLLSDHNSFYVSHPSELGEISFLITRLMQNHDFVLIDKLDFLLEHCPTERIEKFINSLLPYLQSRSIHLFCSQYHTSPALIDTLLQISHKFSAVLP